MENAQRLTASETMLGTLGVVRSLSVYGLWLALHQDEFDLEFATVGRQFLDGYSFLMSKLGLPAAKKPLLSTGVAQDNPVETVFSNAFEGDKVKSLVTEFYGDCLTDIYTDMKLLSASWALASFFSKVEGASAARRSAIDSYRNDAHEMIEWALCDRTAESSSVWNVAWWHPAAVTLRENLIADLRPQQRGQGKLWFGRARDGLYKLMVTLHPHIRHVFERAARAKELHQTVVSCPTGHSGWQRYERAVEAVLRFLFIPPQRSLFAQAETSDRHERRDFVMPNLASGVFWDCLRREFGCKNILIECKNSDRPIDKGDLVQARNYLNRPSVGRFGIIFCRKEPSASAFSERRNAYNDSGALVLFAADRLAWELLVARAFVGDATLVLEREKVLFELAH